MSASTVSANLTSRKRHLVTIDPKSPVTKSPTHSISNETVHVAVKAKKPTSTSAGEAYTRHRKAVTKPKWVTILSVLFKNLLLLGLLIGLVQVVRNFVYSRDGFSIRKGSEFERRVSDVEGMLKKTTEVWKERVEVVDKKIENGLNEVRMDFSKKIDEKNGGFLSELKKYDESIGSLEKALGDLGAEEWLKREDLDGFIAEYRKTKGVDGNSDIDLDEVRKAARGIVERELERYSADGLGRVDYAVASGGAVVVRHSEQYAVGRGIGLFSKVKNGVHVDAVKMITPSFGEPGKCFAIKGSSGFVEIKLRNAIVPEAVTLEHVAKRVAFDRSSAPKDCQISGWLQNHDNIDHAVNAERIIHLTEFTYDLEKSNAQTFEVLDTHVIDTIRLSFTSNHGNPAHTCIYRMRVHGREPDSTHMLDAKS